MGLDPHRALDGAGLRVIQAIDQDGGFSGAAARLGVSPAAISQMVCRLEERSGTPLVERRGRQVRLTEAGHVLARHANGVLSRLVIAENEVAAIAGARAGRMRLMAVHTASGALVPRALAAVRRQFPELVLTFSEAPAAVSLDALRAGECDIAVVSSSDESLTGDGQFGSSTGLRHLSAHRLLDEEIRLVVSETDPLVRAGRVELASLMDATWISGCRADLLNLTRRIGVEPTVSYVTQDYVLLFALVSAGLGVALAPDLVLAAANAPVASMSLNPTFRRQIYAVTTPDLERVPAVEVTLRALAESAARPALVGHV